jgi:hypothetical protein
MTFTVLVWQEQGTDEGYVMASSRRVRSTCARIVNQLELPDPFDAAQLCADLGRRRGREIRLTPASLPPGHPCGLWVSTDEADYLFYEVNTTPLHQEHIIGHELGHLLLDHEGVPAMPEESRRLLFTDLDPAMINTFFGRTHYSREEEQKAEWFASLLLARVRRTPSPAWSVAPDAAELANRLELGLYHRGPGRGGHG